MSKKRELRVLEYVGDREKYSHCLGIEFESTEDIMEAMGVTERTIYNLIESGNIVVRTVARKTQTDKLKERIKKLEKRIDVLIKINGLQTNIQCEELESEQKRKD